MGKRGCIWAKYLYSGKSVCIRARVVVCWTNMVVFGQGWFYSGKMVVVGQIDCIG